jgi:diguanylate cyclase (GGDEF)-like protein/PAS domain S-box-containing protein
MAFVMVQETADIRKFPVRLGNVARFQSNVVMDEYSALMSASCAIMIAGACKPGNPITFVNQAFCELTGYSASEAIGRNCRFLQGPKTDVREVARIRRALRDEVSVRCELLNYKKSGEAFWNELSIDPIKDAEGRLIGFVGVQRDATAAYKAMETCADIEQMLTGISEGIPGYIFRRTLSTDGEVRYPFISGSLGTILGLEEVEWDFSTFWRHVSPQDRAGLWNGIIESAATLSRMRAEFRMISRSGKEYWFRSDSTPRRLADGRVLWDGVALDITSEKSTAQTVAFLASHDALTGMFSRRAFLGALNDAMRCALLERRPLALFKVDVCALQSINERSGLHVGDQVLVETASRLNALAASRHAVTARLAGDKFGIILPMDPSENAIRAFAAAIGSTMAKPMLIGNHDIRVDVYIGAAFLPDAAFQIQADEEAAAMELLRRAQVSLHAAKKDGHGSLRVYEKDLDDRNRNRMTLLNDLKSAIAHKEFELYYQPLICSATNEIISVEALVRWMHPSLGMQGPDLFIPLAEESGLIVPLGEWIIKEALRQAIAWKHLGAGDIRIAVNLSGIQLQRPGFLEMVHSAFAESGVDPHLFEFELTETTMFEASNDVQEQLVALKAMGFGISIDDFGTGFSTFRYLRDFPIDKIKIDQVFIRSLTAGSRDETIVRNMISLAHSLNILVTAEGVETQAQLDFLTAEGCDFIQGYLIGVPLQAEKFRDLLLRRTIQVS